MKNAGSSNGMKSSKKRKRKRKRKTETATSVANLLPHLEAATTRITLALKELSEQYFQEYFDKTARKSF